MKKVVLLLVLISCTGWSQTGAGTSDIAYDLNSPIKKIKKSKNSKFHSGFIYSNNPYKVNTLCKLIQVGNTSAVKSLIIAGEDVNKESNRLTPLMYAARHNRVEILKILIANGADLKARSYKGHTALQWAKMVHAEESYELLRNALKNSRN